MIANIVAGLQGAGDILLHNLLGGRRGGADDDLNAEIGEELLSALAHPPGYDHIGALFVQPAGKHSRFVRRRDDSSHSGNF